MTLSASQLSFRGQGSGVAVSRASSITGEEVQRLKAAAHSHLSRGSFAEAIEVAQDAVQRIRKPPTSQRAREDLLFLYLLIVEARMRLGDILMAEQELVTLAKPLLSAQVERGASPSRASQASGLGSSGRGQSSLSTPSASLPETSPLHISFLFDLVQLHLCRRRNGDALAASEQLEHLLRKAEPTLSGPQARRIGRLRLARTFVMRSHALSALGRLPEAFQALSEARSIQIGEGERCEAALTLAHEVSIRLLSGDSTNAVEDLVAACETIVSDNPSWPGLAALYHNIAVVLNCEGRSQDAVDFLSKAASLSKTFFGEGSPDYTRELLGLAQTQLIIGNPDEAERLLSVIEEGGLPASDGHFLFLRGDLCYFRGRLDDAVLCYREAAAALRESKHDLLAQDAEQALASALQSAGYSRDALLILDGLAARYEKQYGDGSPRTASVYVSLANVFRQQGRHKEAGMLYDRALATFEATYGRNHAYVATVKMNIGGIYFSQADYRAALVQFSHARAIRESCFGGDHPLTVRTYMACARCYETLYFEAGKGGQDGSSVGPAGSEARAEERVCYEDAMYFYEKAMQGSVAAYGADSEEVRNLQKSMVELRRRKRQW